MNRYKWYRLGLPCSHKAFVKNLLRTKFDYESKCGFISVAQGADEDAFRFAWETLLPKTSFDSSGDSSVEFIASVDFCEFSIFQRDGVTWIRIINPPRSLKELMNTLEESAGFGFSSELISFRDVELPHSISELGEVSLIGFRGIGSVPKQHLVARIEVVSRTTLDLDNVEFLRHMSYEIDKCVYEITFQRIRGQISLSATGLVKISGQLAPLVLHLIESDLVMRKS